MGHFLFLVALRTPIEMKPCFLCAAGKHLLDIFVDSRTESRMPCHKLRPVIKKYLLELFASDELHSTRGRRGVLSHLLQKMQEAELIRAMFYRRGRSHNKRFATPP